MFMPKEVRVHLATEQKVIKPPRTYSIWTLDFNLPPHKEAPAEVIKPGLLIRRAK